MSNERVTDDQVRQATGVTSDGDTTQAINIAETIVTDSIVAANPNLSTGTLFNIELYLAAHFFMLSQHEGPLAAEILGDATERYHNIYGAGLKATQFGQQAIALDPTGVLAAMADRAENTARKTARFTVIGDPPTIPPTYR